MEVVRIEHSNFDIVVPMLVAMFRDVGRIELAEATAKEMFEGLGNKDNAVYVIQEKELPLGYIAMETGEDYRGGYLFVQHLYIIPSAKRLGLRVYFEKFAVAFAKKIGRPRIVSALMNPRLANIMCKRMGYKLVSITVEKWISPVQNLNVGGSKDG